MWITVDKNIIRGIGSDRFLGCWNADDYSRKANQPPTSATLTLFINEWQLGRRAKPFKIGKCATYVITKTTRRYPMWHTAARKPSKLSCSKQKEKRVKPIRYSLLTFFSLPAFMCTQYLELVACITRAMDCFNW